MKKILAFLLCAVMTLSVCVAAFPAHAADNCTDGITPGDVNGDGVVDTLDITRLRRYLAEESVDLFPGADMNGDGAVDIEDLTCLRRYLVEAATGLGE